MKNGACTHCGANIEFSAGKSEMVCPYCREPIKTKEAEERLLELQKGGGCAPAFLVSFVVFGMGAILIGGCFNEKEISIIHYVICLILSFAAGVLFYQISNNKYVIEIIEKIRKK